MERVPERLRQVYMMWGTSRGQDPKPWFDLFDPDVAVDSLAGGRPYMPFSVSCERRDDMIHYFEGLARDWDMLRFDLKELTIGENRAIALLDIAWRHKSTGKIFSGPKADFFWFADGRIVRFMEFYDTEGIRRVATP